MATKKSAVAKTAKKAGKAVPARKVAAKKVAQPKRAAKAAPKKAAPKKAAVKKAAPKKAAPKKAVAKKPIAKKAAPKKAAAKKAAPNKTISKKVTARKTTKKMVRPAAKAPVKKGVKAAKPSRPAAPARPAKALSAAKPAAVAKPKAAPVKAPRPAAPARISRPRLEERKALPHKEPPKPVLTLNDYFDMNASPYPTLPPSRREVLPVAVEWKEKMRPGELYQAFKRFFEANEIGNRVSGSLREQSAAIVEFEGDPQIYKIVKIRGRTAFDPGRPASAEIYLKFSRHAVEALLAPNATKPAEYVDRFCTFLTDSDPQKRVEFKLLCTQGEAIRKGYLGVVASGGKRLAEVLVGMGYGMPQDFIRQLN